MKLSTNFFAIPLLILFASLFSACTPEAKVIENKAEVLPTYKPLVSSDKYIVDTKESLVTWYGSMALVSKGSHTGFINFSKGELMLDKEGKLAAGIVDVDMNTIADEKHGSDNGLVRHLKSADFFETDKFPFSTFTIIMITSQKGEAMNVTGSLTIKGLTHTVTFPANMEVQDSVLRASGKLSIDRTKWDVRYKSRAFGLSLADDLISDSIQFEVKLVARK